MVRSAPRIALACRFRTVQGTVRRLEPIRTCKAVPQEFTLAHLCRRPYFNDATKLAKFTNIVRRRDDLIQRVVAVDLAFGRDFNSPYYGGDRSCELADAMSLNHFLATMRNLRRISITSIVGDGYISLPSWVLGPLGDLEHLEELSGVSFGGAHGDASPISSTMLAAFVSLRKLTNTRWPSELCLHQYAPWTSVFGSLVVLEIRQVGELMPYMLWPQLEVME